MLVPVRERVWMGLRGWVVEILGCIPVELGSTWMWALLRRTFPLGVSRIYDHGVFAAVVVQPVVTIPSVLMNTWVLFGISGRSWTL